MEGSEQMSRFEENSFFKLVVSVTVISRTKLTEDEIKGLDVSKGLEDGMAQMKVLEHTQLTEEQGMEELKRIGKDPSFLGQLPKPD